MEQAAAEGDDESISAERPPEKLPTVEPPYGTIEWIQYWSEFEGHLPTPINVSITGSIVYRCPDLRWLNFDVYPHKVKLTNTGYTLAYATGHSISFEQPAALAGSAALAGFAVNMTQRKNSLGRINVTSTQNVHRSTLCDVNNATTLSETAPALVCWFAGMAPKGSSVTEAIQRRLVVISTKWRTERPFLEGGPFFEKHVMSQIHFHWGSDMMEGSDHTIDERRYPGEMQVSFFRSEYLTQEEALKHPDGVTMVCYLIKYGVNPDDRLAWVIEGFPRIQEAQKHTRIGPYPMSHLVPMFYEDYFLYWGKLETVKGEQFVIKWVVPRVVLFASFDQMRQFRKLWDPWDAPNLRNFRPLQEREDRHVFFINPHWCQYNSLLPIPRVPEPSISMLSPAYLKNPWMLPPQNRTEEDTAVQETQTKTSSDTAVDSHTPEARVSGTP